MESYKVIDAGNNVLAVGGRNQCEAVAAEIERDDDRETRVVAVDEEELASLRRHSPEAFCD